LIFLALVVVAYIVVGGVILSYLEKDNEQVVQTQVQAGIDAFLGQNKCINMSDLGTILKLMSSMQSFAVSIDGSGRLVNGTNWDIRTALFVSLQLIATIGFNAAAPQSSGGRAFTIPFAIFGIPLFLVTAIGMGMLLNRFAEWIRVWLTSMCRTSCAPDCGAKVFRTTVIAVIGIVLFLIIPSIIFAQIEPWTYADAFYFSFITLATIGFGDLLPSYNNVPWMSEDYRNWYRLAIAFWILILSAWFAGVIVSIQSTILDKAMSTEQKILSQGQGVSSNNINTNVQLGMNNDFKSSPLQPQMIPYGDDAFQSPQYPVDSLPRSPMPRAVNTDTRDVIAHGHVTRIAI